jgi:hypothetical protein
VGDALRLDHRFQRCGTVSMGMRSPCPGDALDPPLWKFLIKLSLSLSLLPQSDGPPSAAILRVSQADRRLIVC